MSRTTFSADTPETRAAVERFADGLKMNMLAGLAAGHEVTTTDDVELTDVETDAGPDKLVSATTSSVHIAIREVPCFRRKSA